jgi:hypothetical protein
MGRKPNRHDLFLDVDGLVHPWQVFDRPEDVVNDPDLSPNEKRAILASWASDACAIEAAPRKSRTGRVVEFDEIMDALRALDKQAQTSPARQHMVGRHLTARNRGSGQNNQGSPLH